MSDDHTLTDAERDGPYANKTIAEIVHDYAVVRGDLTEQYARDQLVGIIERRLAGRAGKDAAAVAAVRALVREADASGRHISGYGYVLLRELVAALDVAPPTTDLLHNHDAIGIYANCPACAQVQAVVPQ